MQPIQPVRKTINSQTAAFISLFLASLYTQTANKIPIIKKTTIKTMMVSQIPANNVN